MPADLYKAHSADELFLKLCHGKLQKVCNIFIVQVKNAHY